MVGIAFPVIGHFEDIIGGTGTFILVTLLRCRHKAMIILKHQDWSINELKAEHGAIWAVFFGKEMSTWFGHYVLAIRCLDGHLVSFVLLGKVFQFKLTVWVGSG